MIYDNEEAAREIVKVLKKPLLEFIEYAIEERCYAIILEVLKNIKEKK